MKSGIIYLDGNHNVVSKEKSTKAIIHVYDDDGNLIQETVMINEKNQNVDSEIDENEGLTTEQITLIDSLNFNLKKR